LDEFASKNGFDPSDPDAWYEMSLRSLSSAISVSVFFSFFAPIFVCLTHTTNDRVRRVYVCIMAVGNKQFRIATLKWNSRDGNSPWQENEKRLHACLSFSETKKSTMKAA